MELLTSLPAELVAVADPSARGAAPLLRPGEADTESAAAPLPFELYLTALTTPQSAGEAWPPAGKELPVAPPVAASAPQGASVLEPAAADAALLARLKLAAAHAAAGAQLPPAVPASPLPNAEALAPALPASDVLPPASSGAAPQLPLTPDAVTAAPSSVTELVAPEIAEWATQAGAAEQSDLATRLERAAADAARALRPQGTAAEQQAALSPHARSAFGTPDARLAETAAAMRESAPQLEVMKVSQQSTPAVLEATKAGPDWLPASHGTATSAAPASAAAAPAPAASVDLRTPNWQEAFASRVQWLVGSNASEARITLNPPELGAVDVKVSLVDDKTYVQLTTATAAARDELAQSLPRLRELFAASGLELGGASVHDGRGGDQRAGHGDRASAPDSRPVSPFVELAGEPAAAVSRRPLGRVDVFA